MAIQVLILGDIRLYREGLAQLLCEQPDVEVVGSTDDAERAWALMHDERADVVLIDLAMGGALELLRRIRDRDLATRLVALTVPEGSEEILRCAEAGVSSYVTRDGSFDDVIRAVRGVMHDELHCSPRDSAFLLRHVSALARGESTRSQPLAELTRREVEILRHLELDLSNKEIADSLCIAVATVKNHVHNILEKLGVRRRAEAARIARRRALFVDPSREGKARSTRRPA